MGANDPLKRYVDSVIGKLPGLVFVKRIDAGSSATVYQVRQGGRDLALKIYVPKFLTGANRAIELRRVAAQEKLSGHDCPTLVGIESAGEIDDTAYLLMEFIPWRPLSRVLSAVPRSAIRSVVAQVAAAAEFLDKRDLVHRDIKPANILIRDDFKAAKLVDLGVVRSTDTIEADATDQGLQRPFVATAQYSSPEYLFRLVEPSAEAWRALTFYQLGAVLHDLIMKEPIFKAAVETENRYAVAMAVYRDLPVIRASDVDADLIALARQCLLKDHESRLRQVSWSRFSGAMVFDAEAARVRLGLKSTAVSAENAGVHPSPLHHALALKNALNTIRDCVSGIIAEDGYPAPTYNSRHENQKCILHLQFILTTTTGEQSDYAFAIELHWVAEAGGAIQVSVGAGLGSEGEATAISSLKPVAVSDPGGIAEDAGGHLRQILSEKMLRYYDAASILLTSGRLGAVEL